MNLSMRKWRDEEDIWRVRSFLREAYLANDRREISWPLGRFDYWRWHMVATCDQSMDLFLWETAKGEIVAVLLSESGGGDAFLNVHPDARTAALEEEMLAVAEEHLASPSPRGPELIVPVREGDTLREGILAARGYKTFDHWEDQRRLVLTGPLPEGPVPDGYTVRALADLWRSHRGSGRLARVPSRRSRRGLLGTRLVRQNLQRAPLYRRDLDIVAIAPSGEVAAFCTMWYDDATRSGYFAPVGTAPEHQGRGLGRAVMAEAVRRLADMGAVVMHIGGYDPIPKKLYASIGGPDLVRSMSWGKYLAE